VSRMTNAMSSAPAIDVQSLDAGMTAAWDDFVRACPEATFFHLVGWKEVIERAFGHETHYLYASQNERIVGVLPLGYVKSRLFGNALISTPFCVYGGAVAETEEARLALEDAAAKLAGRLDVDYLELRNQSRQRATWPTKELYVTFKKTIDPDPEKNMLAIPRKQRAMVRKGIKAGLASEHDEGIDRFFAAYATSVRNLGTPVFSKRFFQALKHVFGDDCGILTITKDGRLICSVMSFYFRDQVLPYYGGGTGEARALAGNDFMYWELMRDACERGLSVFDFGRSKQGAGSYSFKKNWGFTPEPLNYQFQLVKADEVPEINPLNPKYRMFVNMWRHLPLPVANRLGPVISRSLG